VRVEGVKLPVERMIQTQPVSQLMHAPAHEEPRLCQTLSAASAAAASTVVRRDRLRGETCEVGQSSDPVRGTHDRPRLYSEYAWPGRV
jgi:hypothetical protein